MTEEQRRVHERLLITLPVRTHALPPITVKKGGGRVRTDAECAVMKKKIRALRAKGWRVPRIAEKLGMTRQSVYNYTRTHR